MRFAHGLFRAFPPVLVFEGDDGGGNGGNANGDGATPPDTSKGTATLNEQIRAAAAAGEQIAADGAAAGDGDGDGDGGKDGEDDFKPLTEAEQRKLKEAHDRAQAELRRRKEADDKAERERAEKAGEHDKLAKQERERADKLEGALRGNAVRAAILEAASSGATKFADPTLALELVKADGVEVDLTDDLQATVTADGQKAIKTRLAELLKRSPGLGAEAVRAPGSRQLPGAGNQTGGAKTGGNAEINAQIRRQAGRG